MSRLHRWLARVLLLLFLAVALVFVDACGGAHVLSRFPVRITGVIVDAATSNPIPGVWVVPMRSLDGTQALASAEARQKGLEIADETGHPLRGGARSAADGSFSFVFVISWCRREGLFRSGPAAPQPLQGVEGLLLDKRGSVRSVVATRSGTWNGHPAEAGLRASLDMGVLRVRCEE